jgi:hypothetical protein
LFPTGTSGYGLSPAIVSLVLDSYFEVGGEVKYEMER